jgi:hypothetical protein
MLDEHGGVGERGFVAVAYAQNIFSVHKRSRAFGDGAAAQGQRQTHGARGGAGGDGPRPGVQGEPRGGDGRGREEREVRTGPPLELPLLGSDSIS